VSESEFGVQPSGRTNSVQANLNSKPPRWGGTFEISNFKFEISNGSLKAGLHTLTA